MALQRQRRMVVEMNRTRPKQIVIRVSEEELADRYGIGVTSKNYQEAFGITHKQVKKLEKKGILKVVGNYEFRTYGRMLKAPLYDAYQFAMIADETVKEI